MKKESILIALMLLVCSSLPGLAITRETKTEENGFKWVLVKDGKFFGAETTQGNVIVPIEEEYTKLWYTDYPEPGYFKVSRGGLEGAYTIHGEQAVPLKYKCVFYSPGVGFMYSDSYDTDAANYDLDVRLDSRGYLTHKTYGIVNQSGPDEDVQVMVNPDTVVAVQPAEDDGPRIGVVDADTYNQQETADHRASTEILSADENSTSPTLSSYNAWPKPLLMGSYNLTLYEGKDPVDGKLLYNSVTQSAYLNIKGQGMVKEWHRLKPRQLENDGNRMLFYDDRSTGIPLFCLGELGEGLFVLVFNNDNDETVSYWVDRNSYRSLSPSEVERAAKAK